MKEYLKGIFVRVVKFGAQIYIILYYKTKNRLLNWHLSLGY